MKTILPFLLLIFLASCSHAPPRRETWTPTPAPGPAVAVRTEEHVQPAETNATTSAATPTPNEAVAATNITTHVATNGVVAMAQTNIPPVVAAATNVVAATAQTNIPPVPGTAATARPPVRPAGTAAPGREAAAETPTIPPGGGQIVPSGNVPREETVPAGAIKFRGAPLENVLQIYADYVNRNLLFPGNLNLQTQVTFMNQTPLTRSEVIQALNAVLALNGISMVNFGDKFVKVMPQAEVQTAGAPPDDRTASELGQFGQYVTHVVQLKYLKPSEILPALTPFARIPASIVPLETSQILVLRDYTENVKRMLEMIERVDVAVQSEFISEVIPIKYAQAQDIADVLNSLSSGGGGGGGAAAPRQPARQSAVTRPGLGGGAMPGYPQGSATPYGTGATTIPGAAAGGGPQGSFTANLQRIIQRASAAGGLQLIGENKILADPRSNSLLVFATKPDMEMIKSIIAKLDVVLAQVLIETVIMDVTMSKAWNVGVSGVQTAKNADDIQKRGAGGYNNGQPVFDLVNFLAGAATNAIFPGSLGGGFSYWGQIGKSFDLALQAAASDDRVNVIQTPQILTSHATPGSIFIGSTVPYITTVNYGGSYYGGPSSSYQQLQVGIGLQVTPYINPDGLVVMQIDESIDELAGTTTIANVGDVPNTTSRRLSAEVAVRDGDSIMLGGFIRNSTEKKNSGVPILKDIPLLGTLFSSRSSTKDRKELIVLMRPTVLKTPEIAAKATAEEKKQLPGVSSAEAEIRVDQKKQLEVERKRQRAMERDLEALERKSPSNPSTNTVLKPQ